MARGAGSIDFRRELRRLSRLWGVSEIAALPVVERSSLRRTLGRYVAHSRTIELSPMALESDAQEILTHEAAHAAVLLQAGSRGSDRPLPHGPEWRRLMAQAGFPDARGVRWHGCVVAEDADADTTPPLPRPVTWWDHVCPVCHVSRVARRPVRAWRCAACVAAGLPGHLDIVRRGGPR